MTESIYHSGTNPGTFRPGAIWVRREDDGEVVYAAPDIDEVPELLGELVEQLAESTEHTLIDAAMAHLNLVLIHPFSDGNGRMARCVQTLVIARKHLVAPEFSSIEEYLGRNTRAYDDVLTEVAAGGWQPQRDARHWVRFCLTAHHRQLQTIERRVGEAERLWTGLEGLATARGIPMRSVAGLYDAALGMRLRNASYRSSVASAEGGEISNLTASRDLRALVDAGALDAHGERRGRSYVAGRPVVELYRQIRSERPPGLADPFDLAAERRQGRLFTAPEVSPLGRGGE